MQLDKKQQQYILYTDMADPNKYIQQFGGLNGELNKHLQQPQRQSKLKALATIHSQTVRLDDNNLFNLEEISNMSLKNTRYLSLRQNEISNVIPLTKLDLSSLKTLLLSQNNISSLKQFGHPAFNNLEMLQLMGNKISSVSEIACLNMPHLKSLNLASNKISDLKPLTQLDFGKVPDVKIVLAENPFAQDQREAAFSLNSEKLRVILDWL